MAIGPMQLVLVAFDSDDNFNGQIAAALGEVRARGTIKLIDLLFVHKTDDGALQVIEDSDLTAGDEAAYGAALRALLGAGSLVTGDPANHATPGLGPDELRAVVAELPNGAAFGLLLFEHVWAAGLSAAVRSAGGRLVAQGILTRDALLAMGAELAAVRDAEIAIEAAEAIKGAAMLDALAFSEAVAAAEDVLADTAGAKLMTTIAAQTVRTLMAAGVIDGSELEPAVLALLDAGLLDQVAIEAALASAEARDAAVAELVATQAAR